MELGHRHLTRWLAVAVIGLISVVSGCKARHEPIPTPTPPAEPVLFAFAEVEFDSPEMALTLDEVEGAINQGYTVWLVKLICAEPEGCAAELRVVVEYHTGAEARRISVSARHDVAEGALLRFDALQDPPVPVEAIKRVSVEVVSRFAPGSPRPEPDH